MYLYIMTTKKNPFSLLETYTYFEVEKVTLKKKKKKKCVQGEFCVMEYFRVHLIQC